MEEVKGGIPPTVKVTTGQQKYKTVVHANGHGVIVDEPANMGGSNLGMDPFALLLGSLGSCTAITIKMYADRKGWELDSTTVELSIEREIVDGKERAEITTNILFTGNLSDEQKKRLLQIAHACPVHKTLLGEIVIVDKKLD